MKKIYLAAAVAGGVYLLTRKGKTEPQQAPQEAGVKRVTADGAQQAEPPQPRALTAVSDAAQSEQATPSPQQLLTAQQRPAAVAIYQSSGAQPVIPGDPLAGGSF